MLPIVITVGRDGAGDHAELRYALRAIEAHVPHEQVIIAGHKPGWVRGVEHIAVEQISGDRLGNFRGNVRAACKALPEGFALFHDDMFAMKPIKALEPMHGGPLAARIATIEAADKRDGTDTSTYLRYLRDTLAWLQANGHDKPLAYDGTHVPLPVERPDIMREALLIARNTTAVCVASLYGNLAGIGGRKVGNAKADTGWKTRTWVSTSDERFQSGAVGEFIRGTFAEAGKYEA